MSSVRTFGWRAAEAAVLAGFAFAVGLGLPVALAVGVGALGVALAEAAGERHDAATAARHAALALASGLVAALSFARGVHWLALVALVLAGWLALDALAQRPGATGVSADGGTNADARGVWSTNTTATDAGATRESPAVDVDPEAFADADLAGECLRALRDGPRAPAALADDLGVETQRVRRALAVLDARGAVECDDEGRYRLSGDGVDPFAVLARAADRLVAPLTRLR
ncbi:DNA-binding transcriptional ArsR family regulator [Halarchaeum rubridurum]|uniref:DNA-binding transcriptional ArsR family regulator n=1 Tax=Halarchaeum rubridurum TaxID=489911 RepID=A0A830G3U0_9EURY|nr:hypothetical protein [Halarchaeum rubridurum]MBP1955558.1 DNA-binding transcriptional ArsR family regulator [Halarchaeum rubridurum]GGM73333.1 hypothetical protein GCM10009017_24070 [Halarchaeum rubridurum]